MKNFFLLWLFVASLLTTTAMAQVSKIPADTRLYLQKVETSNNKACARSSDRAAVTPKEAKLFVSCTPGADTKAIEARLKAIGAHPQGTIGRYIMVSTPVGVVDQIAAIEGVTFISRGPSVSQKTLVSREVTGVSKILTGTSPLPQAFTGKDVVVGIIDAGFDFAHPAFKDAEGNLRIKAYYTPGMPRQEGDSPIVTLDGTELAGKVYTTPEDILKEESDNMNESHGSHCAATAAGATFDCAGGMAPEADLILSAYVKTDKDDVDDQVYFMGYNVMQSILYIRDYAKRVGKPYVISMSLNTQEGPHDGTSFTSDMLNQLALEGTNMTLAASNEGYFDCYINHTFAANDTLHTIDNGKMQASAYTRTPGEMSFQIGICDKATQTELWRSEPLRSENNGCGFNLGYGETYGAYTNTDQYEDIKNHLGTVLDNALVDFSIGKLEDGRAKMHCEIVGDMPKNHYFVLHIACSENNVVDLWGDNGTRFAAKKGSDYYTAGNSSVSLGDWCTGGNIITVGSWVSKPSITNINSETVSSDFEVGAGAGSFSPFSSYGTDLAGHNHPFVSTPGSLIISAVNHYDPSFSLEGAQGERVVAMDANGYAWGVESGTSMATPTAAGIIALWLQAKPTLTYEEIKETIIATSNTDEFTEATPIRFGHGKMDAYKGLLHILDIPTSIPTLSRHQPEGVTFRINGGQLFIDGAEDGTPVRIYSISGRLAASTQIVNGSVSLPADSRAGVYAVQVGTLGSTLIRK